MLSESVPARPIEQVNTMSTTPTVNVQSEQTHLQARLEALRGNIEARRDGLIERRDKVRRAFELRSQLAIGQIKDGGRSFAFTSGAAALTRLAEALDWVSTRAEIDAIEASEARIERWTTALSEAAEGVVRPAIEGYDKLNVSAVIEALEGLPVYQVHKVGLYEAAHKNRVTVLRQVQKQLSL